MNKPWTKTYGRGVPHEIDADAYRSVPTLFDEGGRQLRRPAGVRMLRQDHDLPRDRRRGDGGRRLAADQARGQARRPHRADVPERLRLPDRHARHRPCRRGAGERQPALHAARARAPAERRRRRDHRHLRRLDPELAEVLDQTAGQDGDHRRPRRRHRRCRCPSPAGGRAPRRRVRFADVLAEGADLRLRAGGRSPATTSCSSSTPAAPPASPRARRCRTATSSPIPSSSRRSCPRPAQPGREVVVTGAAALPHLRADDDSRLFSLGAETGLVPNPRDMDGFVDAIKDAKFSVFTGVNTLFQGLTAHPRFGEVDLSNYKCRDRRRRGGDRGDLGEVEGADRAPHQGGLRPLGDLADPLPQPDVGHRLHRHLRPAVALDRDQAARRRRQRGRRWRGRRDLRQGPAGDAGLLEATDEANAAAFTADGYFRTGDVGVFDARALPQDRRPQEGHDPRLGLQRLSRTRSRPWPPPAPGVAECACIGVPDEKTGEAVQAVRR